MLLYSICCLSSPFLLTFCRQQPLMLYLYDTKLPISALQRHRIYLSYSHALSLLLIHPHIKAASECCHSPYRDPRPLGQARLYHHQGTTGMLYQANTDGLICFQHLMSIRRREDCAYTATNPYPRRYSWPCHHLQR